MDIVALGELLVDFVEVDADESGYPLLQAQPGGAPANLLATAVACGRSTAMIGKVGADAFGQLLTASLRERGVDVSGVSADPSVFTTLAFVTLDASGERTFSFARKPGADTALLTENVPMSLVESARIFHFGSLSLTDEPARTATMEAVRRANVAGALISYDPNYRPALCDDAEAMRRAMAWGFRQAAIVKLSEEDAAFALGCGPEEAARRLIAGYECELVFCSLGARGCLAVTPTVTVHCAPPLAVEPVDTTGAGDIFTGAALSRLLQLGVRAGDDAGGFRPGDVSRDDLEDVVRFACTMASRSTTRRGGMTSIPIPD